MAPGKRAILAVLAIVLLGLSISLLSKNAGPADNEYSATEPETTTPQTSSEESSGRPVPIPPAEPKAREYFPKSSPEGWIGLNAATNQQSCNTSRTISFALPYCSPEEEITAYSKSWVEKSEEEGSPVGIISGNVFLFGPETTERLEKALAALMTYSDFEKSYPLSSVSVKRYVSYIYLPNTPETIPPSESATFNEEDFQKITYYLDCFEKEGVVYAYFYEAPFENAAKKIIEDTLQI